MPSVQRITSNIGFTHDNFFVQIEKIDDVLLDKYDSDAEQDVANIDTSTKLAILLEYLSDDDVQVRSQAAQALGCLGDENEVPALCHILATDQSPEVRRSAAEALGMIGSEETGAFQYKLNFSAQKY